MASNVGRWERGTMHMYPKADLTGERMGDECLRGRLGRGARERQLPNASGLHFDDWRGGNRLG